MVFKTWNFGAGGDYREASSRVNEVAFADRHKAHSHPVLGTRVQEFSVGGYIEDFVNYGRDDLLGQPFVFEGDWRTPPAEIVSLLSAKTFEVSYDYETPAGGHSGTQAMSYGDDVNAATGTVTPTEGEWYYGAGAADPDREIFDDMPWSFFGAFQVFPTGDEVMAGFAPNQFFDTTLRYDNEAAPGAPSHNIRINLGNYRTRAFFFHEFDLWLWPIEVLINYNDGAGDMGEWDQLVTSATVPDIPATIQIAVTEWVADLAAFQVG